MLTTKKVLIVDDEPGMRQVIEKVLVPHGFEVIDAGDGASALELCRQERPVLTLLDIQLPDMDSADILEGLKRALPAMPVIVLASFGDVEAAEGLVEEGAFGYIAKPFKVDDLSALVMKATASARPALAEAKLPAEHVGALPPEPPAHPRGKRGARAVLITALCAIGAATGGYFAWQKAAAPPPDAEFSVPYSDPSGIYCDGKNLWVCEWASETVYRHRMDKDLSLDKAYKIAGIEPTGIAGDGKNIWTAHSLGRRISRHAADGSMTVTASFKSPGPSPSGLSFDGSGLWSLDFQEGRLYRHNPGADGTVGSSYDSPAPNPCGMFKVKGFYYVADAKSGRIFKLRPGDMMVAGIYALAPYKDGKRRISGIAWDGRSIWSCSAGEGRIYRHRFTSLERVRF